MIHIYFLDQKRRSKSPKLTWKRNDIEVLEESKTKNKEEETNEEVNEEKLLSSSLNAIVVFLTKQKQNIYFDINYQYQFLVFDS